VSLANGKHERLEDSAEVVAVGMARGASRSEHVLRQRRQNEDSQGVSLGQEDEDFRGQSRAPEDVGLTICEA
jgi:hypothetical protein